MQSGERLLRHTEQAACGATPYPHLGQQGGVSQAACRVGRSFRHGQQSCNRFWYSNKAAEGA
jgi:hypothetical protein